MVLHLCVSTYQVQGLYFFTAGSLLVLLLCGQQQRPVMDHVQLALMATDHGVMGIVDEVYH
ncbi:hypothetical protein EGJ23_20120 [Pseudomonas sp. o96-267]|nr:hypothetical protein EGJ23_20120 [Pseudomonas sp. o96-267]